MNPSHSIAILCAPHITDAHVASVIEAMRVQGLEASNLTPLGSPPLDGLVIALKGDVLHPETMRPACIALSDKLGIDVNWLDAETFLTNIQLACFDMDSTIIQQECIDELAAEAGCGKEVSQITEKAMLGDIDFATALRYRVQALSGLHTDAIERIKTRITIQPGAETLLNALKDKGVHTVLVSGGFTPFADHIAQKLGIHEYHANVLETQNDKLTGKLSGAIVDGNAKKRILLERSAQLNIPITSTLAVGDGANDLAMLQSAGLGIAFNAKPKVRAAADAAISALGLEGVLFLLGMTTTPLNNTPQLQKSNI